MVRFIRRVVVVAILVSVVALAYYPLVWGTPPPPAPVITNLRGHPIHTVTCDRCTPQPKAAASRSHP